MSSGNLSFHPHLRPAIEPLEARIAPAAVAAINLGDAAEDGGSKIRGFDGQVRNAGDVNGDGYDDLLVLGASNVRLEDPIAMIVFGKAGGLPADVSTWLLDSRSGVTILGDVNHYHAIPSISGVGDINGDGFDDIAIGADHFTPEGRQGAGAVFIVYGRSRFDGPVNLNTLPPTAGVRIDGAFAYDETGRGVSGAGDVNGDGFDDLIIGAPQEGFGHSTQDAHASVVFGGPGRFNGTFDLATLDGKNGFRITNIQSPTIYSEWVSEAGDFDHDGIDDILIGAAYDPGDTFGFSGAVYVVYGKKDGFAAETDVHTLEGKDGLRIAADTAFEMLGMSVVSAGDINGDGWDDIIAGSKHRAENGEHQGGAAYVIFGRPRSEITEMRLSQLDGMNGFQFEGLKAGDYTGRSVDGAGDINGDGFDDLIIGSPGTMAQKGEAAVILGKRAFPASFTSAALDGSNGWRLIGEDAPPQYMEGSAGFTVSTAGDLNSDGLDDIVVAAPYFANNGGFYGVAYVIYGSSPIKISKDGRTATLPDSDGDLVTVKVSKGTLTRDLFTLGSDGGLESLDLHSGIFSSANVTITAKKVKGGPGDGLTRVDSIDADGVDLGNVTVGGQLGKIAAGDHDTKTAGLKLLAVNQLGGDPLAAGDGEDYVTHVVGRLGALKVKGDVVDALVDVGGGSGGTIEKITIAGDLSAGVASSDFSGAIRASSDIGAVTIKGDVTGGAVHSGIFAGGRLGKVTIGGELSSPDAANPVTISALGKVGTTKAAEAVAIAGISVKGNVDHVRILAGYTSDLRAMNGDAGIGVILVGGNFSASDIVAGVVDTSVAADLASGPDGFGRNDTRILPDGDGSILARIARITIKGEATGDSSPGSGFFGITAQKLGPVTFGGQKQMVTQSLDDIAIASDFHLVDFA